LRFFHRIYLRYFERCTNTDYNANANANAKNNRKKTQTMPKIKKIPKIPKNVKYYQKKQTSAKMP